MVERTRRADQLAAPLTVGGWQHGRADATGRPACSTPDNRRLAAWQNECDRLTSLQHPSQQAAGGMSGTIAMMWPAYNVLAYAGINTPRLPLVWGSRTETKSLPIILTPDLIVRRAQLSTIPRFGSFCRRDAPTSYGGIDLRSGSYYHVARPQRRPCARGRRAHVARSSFRSLPQPGGRGANPTDSYCRDHPSSRSRAVGSPSGTNRRGAIRANSRQILKAQTMTPP
ncbi:hypothetical protein GW17_00045781 [Ensete ventricosum]|nr:hypothetical protein GW17_00045781 [Ensete ventricosum]